MTRCLVAAGLLACGNTATAQQLLFSTFGAEHSFSDPASVIGGGTGWHLSGNNGAIAAAAFVPAMTAPFVRADFAVWYGGTGNDRSGPPSLDITLARDDDGFPGAAIETIHLTGVHQGLLTPGIVSARSTLHPLLASGTQYWFVLSTPDLLHTVFCWMVGPPGTADTFTTAQYLTKVTSFGVWNIVSFATTGRPALAVYGGEESSQAPPAIAPGGVVNGASFRGSGRPSPGSWISIYGSDLSPVARGWRGEDFAADGSLPTSLEGVSVLLNGKPAAISYVSSTQLNVQVPDPVVYSNVPFGIQVVTAAGASTPVEVTPSTEDPALFTSPASGPVTYAAAAFPDGTLVTPAHPAKPGDVISIYGTGFGPTDPEIPAGTAVREPAPLANSADVGVRVAGVPAQVLYAGLSAPGLNQFNVIVPEVPAGDRFVVVTLRSQPATQDGVALPIAQP